MKPEDKHKPTLLSVGELRAMPVIPSEWIVEDLIRIGRRRPSLLAGKPEAGKSTLARQLCVAVAKGVPIFGRRTMRSPVIYWQSEDEPTDVLDSWDRLGYDETKDEKLWTYTGDTKDNHVLTLNKALHDHPDVRLVVVETLDSLLKMDDIKGNTPARIAFDKLDAEVMAHYAHRTSFLCLTHLKKKDCDEAGDMILGATEIRGRTDAKLYMRQVSDEDERRIFHATIRKGRPIPKTFLEFNRQSETYTLGPTVAEERKLVAGQTQERILEKVLTFFENNPDKTFEKDCLPVVSGNTPEKWSVFKKAVADGLIVRSSGTGRKGNPFVYRLADKGIPVEQAAEAERRAA
jgi:hypothetical protein